MEAILQAFAEVPVEGGAYQPKSWWRLRRAFEGQGFAFLSVGEDADDGGNKPSPIPTGIQMERIQMCPSGHCLFRYALLRSVAIRCVASLTAPTCILRGRYQNRTTCFRCGLARSESCEFMAFSLIERIRLMMAQKKKREAVEYSAAEVARKRGENPNGGEKTVPYCKLVRACGVN